MVRRNYTEKQLKFATYLCKVFGMEESKFIEGFLAYYSNTYGYYEQYQSGWYYNSSDAVQALIVERNLRLDKHLLVQKVFDRSYLRATDLSNFTFCPASFSISNTFNIDFPTGENERKIGEQLHDRLNLLKRVDNYHSSGNLEHKLFNEPVILEILKSHNIYAGHKNEKRTFINSELKLACEPDYIFQDQLLNYFVVEEKFHYKKDPRKTTYEDKRHSWHYYEDDDYFQDREDEIDKWDTQKVYFFQNHIIQLLTYLVSIKEYNLKYGYLIYWYYDYNSEQLPYIHKVSAKKITLDETIIGIFTDIHTDIRRFILNKKIDFQKDAITPNKCAGCVVNKYCGHKSKRYEKVTFPYHEDFLNLYDAIYEK